MKYKHCYMHITSVLWSTRRSMISPPRWTTYRTSLTKRWLGLKGESRDVAENYKYWRWLHSYMLPSPYYWCPPSALQKGKLPGCNNEILSQNIWLADRGWELTRHLDDKKSGLWLCFACDTLQLQRELWDRPMFLFLCRTVLHRLMSLFKLCQHKINRGKGRWQLSWHWQWGLAVSRSVLIVSILYSFIFHISYF